MELSRSTQSRLVVALFFATGMSALVYQVIWLRTLATVFGSTTYATTTVLASFMGGLALGSYIFGRLADRTVHPLRLYGLLEIGIGVFALAFPHLIEFYKGLYVSLQQNTEWSFYTHSLVRFVSCSLILIVPTTMMGGTFPIMSRYYVRNMSHLTANVSLLYGVNTVGALTGVVLTGFFFMEMFGIFKTSLIAVAINLFVGASAILLGRTTGVLSPPKAAVSPETAPDAERTKTFRRLILTVAFLSGLASLAYEVLWTRTLVFVLDSFIYSFSIMLATFLAGIGLGSLLLSRIAGFANRHRWLLGVLFVAIGAWALATIPFFAELTSWKKAHLAAISENVTDLDAPAPWLEYILFKALIAFLIMFLPTLLMGIAFPLTLRLYTETFQEMARRIGVVYAVNSIGAIVGAFVAGFVLIPLVGLRGALIATAGLSVATGAALFIYRSGRASARGTIWAAGSLVAFVVIVVALPTESYKRIYQKSQKDFELVYWKEDPTATVTAHKRGEHVIININGLNVAGTSFNFLTTQKIQAHLGLLLHPDPRRVLQIGFGSGGTCYSVSLHESVQVIDCVELCQGVIDAASNFLPSNHGVLKNPKVHLTIEDARNYILATANRYDVILSDSIHPTYAGNGTLYSQDYFELCREKLNPGGYVSFWMPTYLLSERDYKTVIKTFQSVFPNVMIWYVNNAIEAYTVVIGRVEPIQIDVEQLRRKMSADSIGRDLAVIDVYDENEILSYFLTGPRASAKFAEGGDINSDDHPVIELRAPRSMSRRRTWYKNLRGLVEMREPPLEFMTNVAANREEAKPFMAGFNRLYRAVDPLIKGQLINLISYNFKEEYEYYEQAERICPESRAVARMKKLAASRVMILEGEARLEKGQREEAVQFFDRAIAVNPDPYDDSVGQAWYRKGWIDFQQGDFEGAGRNAQKCLDVFPTHKNALILNAMVAIQMARPQDARRIYEHLHWLYPHDAQTRDLRGRIDAVRG